MKNMTIKMGVAVLLFVVSLSLPGCSSDTPAVDSERLATLETEVKALKQESRVREKAFREELAMIRKNLEGIQSLMEVEKSRADVAESPAPLPKAQSKAEPEVDGDAMDEALDAKAKEFVSENLDRLLAITKKLLDKMEMELDEQMRESPNPVSPKDDEI